MSALFMYCSRARERIDYSNQLEIRDEEWDPVSGRTFKKRSRSIRSASRARHMW